MINDMELEKLPQGSTDPRVWLRFVGLIASDDLQLMEEAIEAAFHQIES